MDMNNQTDNYNDMMNNVLNNTNNYIKQQPLPFITGKIGFWDIAREDIDSFGNNVRLTEWTNNQIYQNAKDVDISTTLSTNKTITINKQQKKNKFNSLYLNFSPHLNEFENYKREWNERKQKTQEEIYNQKNNFLNKLFLGNVYEPNIETIYAQIKYERYNLITKDPKLVRILGDLLPFFDTQLQTQQKKINNTQQQGPVDNNNNLQGKYSQFNNSSQQGLYTQSTSNNQQVNYNQQGMYGNQTAMNQQEMYNQQQNINQQYNNSVHYGNPNQYQGRSNNQRYY